MLTDRERYLSSFESCAENARACETAEIQLLWATMAKSYRFLIDREDRLDSEAKERGDSYRAYSAC